MVGSIKPYIVESEDAYVNFVVPIDYEYDESLPNLLQVNNWQIAKIINCWKDRKLTKLIVLLQPSGSIDTLNDVNSDDDLYVNTMLFDDYDDFDEEYFDDLQVISW